MLSNAYFLAKFRFDTAENEPAKNLQNFAKFANFADPEVLGPVRWTQSGPCAREGRFHLAHKDPFWQRHRDARRVPEAGPRERSAKIKLKIKKKLV